jgi:hypothetical protein
MIETISSVIKVGDKYGRYSILGIFKEDGKYPKYARAQCACGSAIRYVPVSALRNGQSKSCGCLHKERVTKHGAWNNPLFQVWKGMIDRCTNPNNKRYARYGGRGINVCDRWLDVNSFITDMTNGYEKGLQINRIDNNGNYSKDNCEWATTRSQTRNYSRNVVIEHNGKTLCAVDWAIETGIPAKVIYDRISSGWSKIDAITKPIMTNEESIKKALNIRWNK